MLRDPTDDRIRYIQHPFWVWKDRVNFIIQGDCEFDGEPYREQLGVRTVDQVEFELCCLPFYLKGYALGDVVATAPGGVTVDRLVRPSGRKLFRIMFYSPAEIVREITANIEANLRGSFEWHSPVYCAVDVPDQESADVLFDYLVCQKDLQYLAFDTGN